jgi:hypothetical protein
MNIYKITGNSQIWYVVASTFEMALLTFEKHISGSNMIDTIECIDECYLQET